MSSEKTEKEQELTLDEAFARLDEKIGQLQDPQTSLEEAFRIYEEGMSLLKMCTEKIDLVEKKVMMIGDEGGETDEL